MLFGNNGNPNLTLPLKGNEITSGVLSLHKEVRSRGIKYAMDLVKRKIVFLTREDEGCYLSSLVSHKKL